MHAVCETHAFRRATAGAGMSEDDIAALVGVRAYLLIIERDARRVLELLSKARGRKAA